MAHPTEYQKLSSFHSEEADVLLEHEDTRCTKSRQIRILSSTQDRTSFALCFILLLTYTAAVALTTASVVSYRRENHPIAFSPARDVAGLIRVEPFENAESTINSSAWDWHGTPSPELDQRWDALMNYSTFRMTNEEMRHLGREDESVQFSDGSGYMAQLTVFHHLHCINRIHKTLHPSYYYPGLNSTEWQMLQIHNAHCLNILRQGIQCQGDVSPITMKWYPHQRLPGANMGSPHQCVDWDAIMDWSKDRWVDVQQPGLVIHPTLGPAYEGPKGKSLGLSFEMPAPE